jgi:hypothetical protein
MKKSKKDANRKNKVKSYNKQIISNLEEKSSFSRQKLKFETPIDRLYNQLKKSDLKLSAIMNTFDLDRDQALAWCEVLTNKELAELRYGLFGEPILKLKAE